MTATYTVPGISCDHCKVAIEAEVSIVAGVSAVKVDVEAKTVRVEGEPADADIRAAIEEAGYQVASTT